METDTKQEERGEPMTIKKVENINAKQIIVAIVVLRDVIHIHLRIPRM